MEKKHSFFDGETYRGYKISLKLVREGIDDYQPARIHSPTDVYQFMSEIKNNDRERFYSVHLDTNHSIVSCEEVSSGTVECTVVHPREVFKSALLCSSCGIILVHNHPSGTTEPSEQDKILTKRLYVCGELMGIQVFDSVIIGLDSYYSFLESGLFEDFRKGNQLGDRKRGDDSRFFKNIYLEM
jgi:DNA repair protein RadC